MDILDYGLLLQGITQDGTPQGYIPATEKLALHLLPEELYHILWRGNIIGEIEKIKDEDHVLSLSLFIPPLNVITNLSYKFSEKELLKSQGLKFFKTVFKRYLKDGRLQMLRKQRPNVFKLIEDVSLWTSNLGD